MLFVYTMDRHLKWYCTQPSISGAERSEGIILRKVSPYWTLDIKNLTPFHKTNFRLFQTKRNYMRHFFFFFQKMVESPLNGEKTLWEMVKLLVWGNFSLSHKVFNRLVLQTRKNQGLFGKWVKCILFTV